MVELGRVVSGTVYIIFTHIILAIKTKVVVVTHVFLRH